MYFRALFFIAIFLSGCTSIKLAQNRPLEGKDISTHALADGQVEFRLKVTGLTSNVWLTTELINKSNRSLHYNSQNLIDIGDNTCLKNFQFEKEISGAVEPNERIQLRYSYQDKGKQKYSDQYEECRLTPLKFKVSGLSLENELIAPLQLTIYE